MGGWSPLPPKPLGGKRLEIKSFTKPQKRQLVIFSPFNNLVTCTGASMAIDKRVSSDFNVPKPERGFI